MRSYCCTKSPSRSRQAYFRVGGDVVNIKDHIDTLKLTASHDHAKCEVVITAKAKMDQDIVAAWESGRACGFHAGWDEGFRSPGKVLRIIHDLMSKLVGDADAK